MISPEGRAGRGAARLLRGGAWLGKRAVAKPSRGAFVRGLPFRATGSMIPPAVSSGALCPAGGHAGVSEPAAGRQSEPPAACGAGEGGTR